MVAILAEGRLLATRSMADFHAKAGRRMELRFDDQVPVGPIQQADGVRQVEVVGLVAHVMVAGSMADLFRAGV